MEPLLPNFLIAGVQKGGTCAASINLSLHPNIKVARKEVHFFDGHWQQGVEWYHQKMHEIHKPHALLGDRTPAYFTDPRMHPRMMSVVPNAKIIILLRNPATRFISQWLMHKRQNAQHKRQNAQRQRDNTLESIIDRNCSDLFHRGLYFKHLRSLYKYFPKEQIHIAISERVKSNREKEYAKMFHFLGVDPLVGVQYKLHNVAKNKVEINPIFIEKLQKKYQKPNEKLFELLGYRIPEWDDLDN